jgi:adenylate cyclase
MILSPKKRIAIYLIVLLTNNVQSQNDSGFQNLINTIERSATDTARAHQYLYWCREKTKTALYVEAKQLVDSALNIAINSNNKTLKADALSEMGYLFWRLKDFNKALNLQQEAYSLYKTLGDKNRLAVCMQNIGHCQADLHMWNDALVSFRKSLETSSHVEKDIAAKNYNLIGYIHMQLANYDSALFYYNQTLNRLSQLPNDAYYSGLYHDFAIVYAKQGKKSDAHKMATLSIDYGLKSKSISHIYEAFEALEIATLLAKNYNTAYYARNQKDSISQLLNFTENNARISQIQMTHYFEKQKQQTLAEQQIGKTKAASQLQKQKLIRNFFIVGFCLALLFCIIIFKQRNKIADEKRRSDNLLLNILPAETADELRKTGAANAKDFKEVTILFTDFKNFTALSERLTAQQLVNEIDFCYSAFDKIISKYGIEKIKTIGDSYMCAGGLPITNTSHAVDCVHAAIEMQTFMKEFTAHNLNIINKEADKPQLKWELRIGLHTGSVVAGIVGIKKFAYDIWGDAVNIASRMESSSEPGKVNISGSTYHLVKNHFHCEYRGKIMAKNKGEIDMYFVS